MFSGGSDYAEQTCQNAALRLRCAFEMCMMNSMRSWRCLVVGLLIAASACSSPSNEAQRDLAGTTTRSTRPSVTAQLSRAERACEAHAAPGAYFSASETNVQAARDITIGTAAPSGGLTKVALRGQAANGFAAFCWRKMSNGDYESYLIGTNDKATLLGRQQQEPSQPGPPIWP